MATTETMKSVTDGAVGTSAVVSFLGWLPEVLAAIASLMSIVWFGIRFYEYFKNKKVKE